MALIEPGQMLGKYRIERQIGAGGMSDVYQAMDSTLKRQVALKVLTPEVSDDPEHVQRFRKEVLAVAALDHPGIVTIFDVGSAADHQFYAMALLPGGNLKNRLADGPFAPERALEVLRALALALDHAHSHQIIHRDIKPENVLFDRFDQPMLVDFGIARMLGESTRITAVGTSVGTPYYMSPEQAQADANVDARTDLYSLGVLLYEMLTGDVPYDSNTAVGIAMAHANEPVPTLPSAAATLQPLLDTLLAKSPAQRPISAAAAVAIVDDLSRRLAEQSNAAEQAEDFEPALPPSKTQAMPTFTPDSRPALDPETEFELPVAGETSTPPEPAEPDAESAAEDEVPETEFELPVLSETTADPDPASPTKGHRDDGEFPGKETSEGEQTETSFSARSQQLSIHADTSTQNREPFSESDVAPAEAAEGLAPAAGDSGDESAADPVSEEAPEEAQEGASQQPRQEDERNNESAEEPPAGFPAEGPSVGSEGQPGPAADRDPRGQTVMAPALVVPAADEPQASAEVIPLTGVRPSAVEPQAPPRDPWYGRPGALGLIGIILVALLIGLTRLGDDEEPDQAPGDSSEAPTGDVSAPDSQDETGGENLDALLLEVLENELEDEAAAASAPAASGTAAAEVAPSTGAAADPTTAEIEQLLRDAEVFRAVDQLTLPDGENAWEAYQAVLDLDPTNATALRGLAALQRTYVERSRSALARGDRAAARATIARLRFIDPIHPDLAELENTLLALDPEPPELDSVEAAPSMAANSSGPAPDAGAGRSEPFSDPLDNGAEGPVMIPLPGGSLRLAGTGADAPTITAFALAQTETTVRQFEVFVAATGYQSPEPGAAGCNYWLYNWRQRADRGWQSPGFNQSPEHPVVCVSYTDARAYVDWLSAASGARYRLPTEAEWAFAARREGVLWSSSRDACDLANVSDIDRADRHNLVVSTENVFACRDGRATTAPVATYQPSGDGFHDLLGNAAEWTADCWNETPGSTTASDCNAAPVRGGSWFEQPADMTRENRLNLRREDRFSHVGFRVLREL